MTRILRILTRPNIGGPMRQAIALWHAGQGLGQQTLLAVGSCRSDEASFDLAELDIPLLDLAAVTTECAGLVQVDSLGRSLAPIKDRRAGSAIARLIRAFEPQVVHTHTSKAGWLGRHMAMRSGVPVIAHTYHGHVLRDYFSPMTSWFLAQKERRLARRTDLLYAVSESCRSELAELKVSNCIEVIRPAVACQDFKEQDRAQARRLLGLSSTQIVLGFVGRLVPVKSPQSFLDVLMAMPEAHGLVFGAGPLQPKLRAHPAASRVQWRGADSDLGMALPAVDALVMPSLREGMPLAGIEAAAAGVATVGYDVPGVGDLIRSLGSGVLVPRSHGVAGLVAGLRALITEDPRARVGSQAREFVATCEPQIVARGLLQRYREALDRRGAKLKP